MAASWTGWWCESCGTTTVDEPVRCRCDLWLGPGYSDSETLVPAPEVERLERDSIQLREVQAVRAQLQAEVERLREENERYHKALEWIFHGNEDHAWEVARRALDG